jgi:hypothetical protein
LALLGRSGTYTRSNGDLYYEPRFVDAATWEASTTSAGKCCSLKIAGEVGRTKRYYIYTIKKYTKQKPLNQ